MSEVRNPAPPLYSAYLQKLSQVNKSDIFQLESSMRENCRMCNEFGIPHLHANEPGSSEPAVESQTRPKSGASKTKRKLTSKQVVFHKPEVVKAPHVLDGSKKDYVEHDYVKEGNSELMETWCYLCSTLEEHKQHMKTVKKVNGKPRKKYEAPPPKVTRKWVGTTEKQSLPSKDAGFYKVVVHTGKGGTTANVQIRLFGGKTATHWIPLRKTRMGSFLFMPFSKENFHVKEAKLDNVHKLQVRLQEETIPGFFVESIEVTSMHNNQTRVFKCDNWLSSQHGDKQLHRVLAGEDKVVTKSNFKVSVATGSLKKSWTDSRVYLTLVGSKRWGPKKELKSKGASCFSRGSIDEFNMEVDDIGTLRKIRIEHDGRGKSRRWHLLAVMIEDMETGKKYLCRCNQWLVEEEGNAKWRELLTQPTPAHTELSEITNSGTVVKEHRNYEVEFHTGSRTFAGTDAKVFVEIYGQNRTTGKLTIPASPNCFETGKIDSFEVSGVNVGEISKLRVGHDNSGIGSGWYLDKVVVRRTKDVLEYHDQSGEESGDKESDDKEKDDKEKDDEKERDESEDGKYPDSEEMFSGDEEEIRKVFGSVVKGHDEDRRESHPRQRKIREYRPGPDRKSNGNWSSYRNTSLIRSQFDDMGDDYDDDISISDGNTSLWSGSESEEEIDGPMSETESIAKIKKSKEKYSLTRKIQRTMAVTRVIVEEYEFVCNRWLAIDEGDKMTECTLTVSNKRVFAG